MLRCRCSLPGAQNTPSVCNISPKSVCHGSSKPQFSCFGAGAPFPEPKTHRVYVTSRLNRSITVRLKSLSGHFYRRKCVSKCSWKCGVTEPSSLHVLSEHWFIEPNMAYGNLRTNNSLKSWHKQELSKAEWNRSFVLWNRVSRPGLLQDEPFAGRKFVVKTIKASFDKGDKTLMHLIEACTHAVAFWTSQLECRPTGWYLWSVLILSEPLNVGRPLLV